MSRRRGRYRPLGSVIRMKSISSTDKLIANGREARKGERCSGRERSCTEAGAW